MATVNQRVYQPQACVINGRDAGGKMRAAIQCGYDQLFRSSPDGLQVPMLDRQCQFCRGSLDSQDWPHLIELLTGTVGTYVFYERKSGVAEATGFIKHTLTNPVIHRASLRISSGEGADYAGISADFECKAADETKGFADMWALTDSQAAPSYITADRGGIRIETTVLGALSIYHVTALTLDIALPLKRACNDNDVGYTAVDAVLEGLTCRGSLSFQDASISVNALKLQQILAAARASLVVTVRQAGGAADKTLTIAGVQFLTGSEDANVNSNYSGFTAQFEVTNNASTQLTLAGTNKIITVA